MHFSNLWINRHKVFNDQYWGEEIPIKPYRETNFSKIVEIIRYRQGSKKTRVSIIHYTDILSNDVSDVIENTKPATLFINTEN